MNKIILSGDKPIIRSMNKMIELLQDKSLITSQLEKLMRDYVHVDTGYLKSTIYSNSTIAGAKAEYAGYEEERGDKHAYATKAIAAYDVEKYIDKIVSVW